MVGATLATVEGLVGYWPFDEGSGLIAHDSSPYGNDGTLNGPSWVDGKLGKALSFDGQDDYIDCGNDPSLNIQYGLTIALWVKLPGNPMDFDKNWYLIGKGNALGSDVSQGAYTLSFYKGNNKLYFDTGNGTLRDTVRTVKNDWTPNTWYHIAVVWDGTQDPNAKKIYIDGGIDAADTSIIPCLIKEVTPFRIGYSNLDYFQGVIDEVQLYNRALTEAEIVELYEAAIPTPTPTPTCVQKVRVVNKDTDVGMGGVMVYADGDIYKERMVSSLGECTFFGLTEGITYRIGIKSIPSGFHCEVASDCERDVRVCTAEEKFFLKTSPTPTPTPTPTRTVRFPSNPPDATVIIDGQH